MLKIITGKEEKSEEKMSLDDWAREGARRMIQAALEAEVEDYMNRLRDERDENDRARVVRNGKAKPRRLTVGSGTVEIQAPRINDKRKGYKFSSGILPPYVRRSPNVSNVLPILYLRGLSTGDFGPALNE